MNTENFYSKLQPLDKFINITNYQSFVAAPDDWQIIITDIVNSTKLIEAGRYKDVNIIGVCSIAAVINITNDIEIPFIFGGDGATLLIPPSLLSAVKQALLLTKDFAKQKFSIDLRVGIVPVNVVRKENYDVKIAKFKVLNKYNQGVFTGGGINYATNLVKNPETTELYSLDDSENTLDSADFSGVACPWQDIKSQHGEIVSLIVTSLVEGSQESSQIYQEVLEQISIIYGSEDKFHPVVFKNLNLTFNNQKLYPMLKIHHNLSNWIQKTTALIKLKIGLFFGFLWMEFRIKFWNIPCPNTKQDFIAATDYRKFCDTLNMVISGNSMQRRELEIFLEKQYQQGKLVYGLHVSNRALMTCYTRNPQNDHVHFVDGADGGYALAAKSMKERIKFLNQQQQ